jgi:hypothetical protein
MAQQTFLFQWFSNKTSRAFDDNLCVTRNTRILDYSSGPAPTGLCGGGGSTV